MNSKTLEIQILENTYLSEDIRLTIIKSYLLHEHKKLFQTNSNYQKEKINNAMKRLDKHDLNFITDYMKSKNPDGFINSLGLKARWKLFHIVSSGIYEKQLWSCVGHPAFAWRYIKNLSVFDCIFESKVGWMKEINYKWPTFGQALEFAVSKKEILKNIIDVEYDKDSREDRSKDPIIGRLCDGGKVSVHNGNGRLTKIISNIIFRNPKINGISAFIGEMFRIPNDIDKKVLELFKREVFVI
jgi:hypothetical protein